MNLFQNPGWINKSILDFRKLDEVPQSLFDEINDNLDRVISSKPVISIIIAAWNEETNIIRCLYTLSKSKTSFPFEIIVVNNNSKDRTQETLDRLHVRSLFETKQGCGPARQLGQEKAYGDYVLLADADCLYPDCWVEEMGKALIKDGVVCVYGRYSFLAQEGQSRFKFAIYEAMKDLVAEVRHIKRPHLNAYGISMGYVRSLGLKAGYIDRNVRGDDGRLCFDLMPFGKVVQVRSRKARAWTGSRTLERDGSFTRALVSRFLIEISRIHIYFKKQPAHDTKTSENEEYKLVKMFEKTAKKS